MAIPPPLSGGEKKYWWLSNRKIVEKYVKEARALIASHDQAEITCALNHLDAALALYPKFEDALELKARSLLYLRRYKEVADMLQEYIPSIKIESEDSSLSSESSSQLYKERAKLLPDNSSEGESGFKCFSVADLKKKVMAGLCMHSEKEGHWRYSVVGQACYHLGLLEDAMVLLQTGKRLAAVSSRQESVYWSEDSFSSSLNVENEANLMTTLAPIEDVSLGQLLSHIKILLGRRTAAMSALDAGHYSEAIRHFSKILDGRRGTPQGFLAGCYVHRANSFKAAGRVAEAIADCNRALALDPTCIPALSTRASLLESIRCFQECLRDLEHLRLLYNTILRDRKLPGPAWRRHNIHYRDVAGNLNRLNLKIQEFRQRIGLGETGNVDYYALIGLRRGCSRSELERAHLLLCLRHSPDKALNFIERCEFLEYHDLDLVKDQARMSALLLHRMLQKAYSNVMTTIMDEEAAERQRQKTAAALQVAAIAIMDEEAAAEKQKQKTAAAVAAFQAAAAIKVATQEQALQEIRAQEQALQDMRAHEQALQEIRAQEQALQEKRAQEQALQEIRNKAMIEAQNRVVKSNIEVHTTPLLEPSNFGLCSTKLPEKKASTTTAFQGGLCRDIAIVANMLSKSSFNHTTIPVKYEALSC
ncbi:hypothetical protein ACHQM5_026323 [Ranunculus cassubicifolius]